MRVSHVLCLLLAAGLALCRGEEVVESRGFFKELVNKTKNGLGKLRRSLSPGKNKGGSSKTPLAEGVGAVLDAIDELVAEGQAVAGKANKKMKETAGGTKESVKDATGVSKDKLDAASAEVKSTADAAVASAAAGVDSYREGIEDLAAKGDTSAETAAESAVAASEELQDAVEKSVEAATEALAEEIDAEVDTVKTNEEL